MASWVTLCSTPAHTSIIRCFKSFTSVLLCGRVFAKLCSRFCSQLDWGTGRSAATNLARWMHGGLWFHSVLAHGISSGIYRPRSRCMTGTTEDWERETCLALYLTCRIVGLWPAFWLSSSNAATLFSVCTLRTTTAMYSVGASRFSQLTQ